MAPKRKEPADSTAVTRRSTRLANAAVAPLAADPKPPKKKKPTAKRAPKPPPPACGEEAVAEPELEPGKTIIVEHCKQCNSFKTRALQVKDGVEKGVAGVKVVVNPEKPRRGCFEIREEGGEVFLSLVNLKRPFPPLKALDMEKVIADVVEKIR